MSLFFFTVLFLNPSLAIQGGQSVDSHSPLAAVSVSLGDISSGKIQNSYCSGTLVSAHALVTAAHCVLGKNPAEIMVEFGIDATTTTIFRSVTQIVIPQEYQPYDSQLPKIRDAQDIGIVFFSGELPAGFKPAIMVDTELDQANEGQSFLVAGFGNPEAGSLHTCATTLLRSNFSRSEFQLFESITCALGTGDSGGAVYQIQNQTVALFGIHDWGWHDQNGRPAYSVETKLSFYGPWIRTLPLF